MSDKLREKAKAWLGWHVDNSLVKVCEVVDVADLVRALLAENERLRHDLFGGDMALSNAYDQKEAEIARLRARVAELDDLHDPYALADLRASIKQGNAEIARLRRRIAELETNTDATPAPDNTETDE